MLMKSILRLHLDVRLAKFYHPDVYDFRGTLEEGETAEARFIKIQAAYELLIDEEIRKQYDIDNRINPMKASQAWTEWVMRKRKAWDRRGEMFVDTWADQRQLDRVLHARCLSRSKVFKFQQKKNRNRESGVRFTRQNPEVMNCFLESNISNPLKFRTCECQIISLTKLLSVVKKGKLQQCKQMF